MVRVTGMHDDTRSSMHPPPYSSHGRTGHLRIAALHPRDSEGFGRAEGFGKAGGFGRAEGFGRAGDFGRAGGFGRAEGSGRARDFGKAGAPCLLNAQDPGGPPAREGPPGSARKQRISGGGSAPASSRLRARDSIEIAGPHQSRGSEISLTGPELDHGAGAGPRVGSWTAGPELDRGAGTGPRSRIGLRP